MNNWIGSVTAGTTGSLPPYTFTGTVLTAAINGPLPAQDGFTLGLNDTLLVMNETGTNQVNCGAYVLTQVGADPSPGPGAPWKLTRMPDSNTAALLATAVYMVINGNTLASQIFYVNVYPITLGTTAITFASINASTYFSNSFVGVGTASNPIDLSGSVVKGVVLNLPGASVNFATSGNVAVGTISGNTGQATLASGIRVLNILGVTTASIAIITMVSPVGTVLTVTYQAVCTTNTLTIQANIAAGTINTFDASTLNFLVIN